MPLGFVEARATSTSMAMVFAMTTASQVAQMNLPATLTLAPRLRMEAVIMQHVSDAVILPHAIFLPWSQAIPVRVSTQDAPMNWLATSMSRLAATTVCACSQDVQMKLRATSMSRLAVMTAHASSQTPFAVTLLLAIILERRQQRVEVSIVFIPVAMIL